MESGELPRTVRGTGWLVEPRHQEATGIEPVFALSSLEIVHRPCPLIGKISEGTRVDVEHGLLVVTDAAVYNISGTKVKRRIPLAALSLVTASEHTGQFILHVPSEYDYLYSAPTRGYSILDGSTTSSAVHTAHSSAALWRRSESCDISPASMDSTIWLLGECSRRGLSHLTVAGLSLKGGPRSCYCMSVIARPCTSEHWNHVVCIY